MQTQTKEILEKLNEVFGKVDTFLNHQTPFQLLIAVILSAQTTDNLVNKVTPFLFEKYPSQIELARADINDIEKLIHSVNYHRTKARHIIATAKMIEEDFDNQIPNTIDELIKLPGVGRKVANVVVAEVHGIPEGIVVDTHIKRVSKRIGWTESLNPTIIERDLMKFWPKEYYVGTPKQIILIGRSFCYPQKPNCIDCPLNKWCEKNIT